jgi:ADP-ribosylglycohydrolase
MHKSLVIAGVVGALALPSAALADATPTSSDVTHASQQCRTERGTSSATREAFAQRYGTNKNKSNAFGKCVSKAAKAVKDAADEQDAEEISDRRSAAKQCAQERGTTSASKETFGKKYGTNASKSNAFGKCVSKAAKALSDDDGHGS